MNSDLGRLRRFALTAAVLLFTYTVAGIVLEPDAKLTVFGVPFHVARPDLLPIGLACASVWGLVRFYYYGMMLGRSPYRIRRELLDDLLVRPTAVEIGIFPRGDTVPMYFGATTFETSPVAPGSRTTGAPREGVRRGISEILEGSGIGRVDLDNRRR